jgi:hypothetical protein
MKRKKPYTSPKEKTEKKKALHPALKLQLGKGGA